MKISLTLLLFCLVGFLVRSQNEVDTLFFDANWQSTSNRDSVSFYGFQNYDAELSGLCTYYYATGELHSYQNETNGLKNGHCIWFYKNGNKMAEGIYFDDMPKGEQVWYDETGSPPVMPEPIKLKETHHYVTGLNKAILIDSLITIGQPEKKSLYRNYQNVIEIGIKSGCAFDYSISCINCDTLYNLEGNTFVIVPGEAYKAHIIIRDRSDTNLIKVVSNTEFRVRNLPDPNIYIGGVNQEGSVYYKQAKMFAKYPPEEYLNEQFNILQWLIHIDNKEFLGVGNTLTAEVLEEIKNLKEGERIELEATVISTYNEQFSMKTFFIRASDDCCQDN